MNDYEYKKFSWVLSVSAFITFVIFLTHVFTVNVLKNLFPFFTPIINQENLIFLFAFLVFSFFQYLVFWGTKLAVASFGGVPSDYKTQFQIESIISFVVLFSSLFLPFFISFSYLKNVYPTFEHFFTTGEPNWVVYLTIFIINHIIFFIGTLIIVRDRETIEKIIFGVFVFPLFCLISIFISAPLIIFYFISKIVPFFSPLCVNCSNGAINWFSIIAIFLLYSILYIPLYSLFLLISEIDFSFPSFIMDKFIKKTNFGKEEIEKELIVIFKKTIEKSKDNPEILKNSNIFKNELKKISKQSKLDDFLNKNIRSNHSNDSYGEYIDCLDNEILNLYFDSGENINYRFDLIKSIFENNRKKSEKFIDYYFIDHIMDTFYQVLELDKINNPPINYKNVKLNDKVFEKLYKIGLIKTSDKFTIDSIVIPKIFKFEDKYYKITKIGKKFFKDCKNLQQVIIPESVKRIDNYAFKNCENLKKIFFHKKLTEIGIGTFEHCTSLDISSFDYIEKIRKYAFKNCKSLKELYLNKKLNKIEKGIFENCYSLNIYFFNMPKEIGDYAFKNCKSLRLGSFAFEKVKYIGKKAFYGCKSLKEVEFKNISQIGDKAFAYCTSIKEVKISDTVEKIGNYAFKNCKKLNQIVVPSKVKNIGIGAFQNINNIIYGGDLDISNFYSKNVKREMNVALNNDILEKLYKQEPFRFKFLDENINKPFDEIKEKIISIDIPENFTYDGLKYNITEIGDSAFKNCIYLIDIVIPDFITILGHSSFENCTKLTNVKISKNLIEIANSCFSYCVALKEITIPDSVKRIGGEAFSYCTELEKIKLPKYITTIEGYTFDGCYSLKYIDIPNTVTKICNYAFKYCNSSLNFEIPNSVKKIGKGAFAEKMFSDDSDSDSCYESFCGSQKVSELLREGIYEHHYLLNNKHDKNRTITIPDSVIEIGHKAFNGVEKVYYNGKAKGAPWGANHLKKKWKIFW